MEKTTDNVGNVIVNSLKSIKRTLFNFTKKKQCFKRRIKNDFSFIEMTTDINNELLLKMSFQIHLLQWVQNTNRFGVNVFFLTNHLGR